MKSEQNVRQERPVECLVGRLRSAAALPTGLYAEAATEIEELRAQVRSLQSALDFWLPGVPAEDSPRQSVIADHAWLLCGFDGEQPSAEKLGWIALTPNAVAQGRFCPEGNSNE